MKINLNKLIINNVTMVIILGQLISYLAINAGYISYNSLSLNYTRIFSGEFWRVISFIFIPPASSPLLSILNWYILYLMGSNLEHFWGAKHYNIYLLLAIILTNAVAFIFNLSVGTNYYFQSSIFLAFAFINPNFQVRLFFIIPVKIKWISIVMWLLYLWTFIIGNFGSKLLIIASVLNFIIYFGKDIYYKVRYQSKSITKTVKKGLIKAEPTHKCVICSKNDKDYPFLEFRYCSKCSPEQCYCEEHLKHHNHITT